jgi:hypothetical protein
MERQRKPALKASTFAIRTSQRTDQKLQKNLLSQPRQKLLLKNFPTLQKIKIHLHTARQTQQTMTLKLNIDKAYNDTLDRRPAGNRRLAQWRVTWLIEHSTSHQHLWCIYSFVLRNPPLRQAPKRYSQW